MFDGAITVWYVYAMKIHVKKEPHVFEPIELTVTIESADELRALWHRLNVEFHHLTQRWVHATPLVSLPDISCADELTDDLFTIVDKLSFEHGLRSGGQIGRAK